MFFNIRKNAIIFSAIQLTEDAALKINDSKWPTSLPVTPINFLKLPYQGVKIRSCLFSSLYDIKRINLILHVNLLFTFYL